MWANTACTLTSSWFFSFATGFTATRVFSPIRKNWNNLIGKIIRHLTDCMFYTWWFLNADERFHRSIAYWKFRVSMGIVLICFTTAIVCIRIIVNVILRIDPERYKVFVDTIDQYFFDQNLKNGFNLRFLNFVIWVLGYIWFIWYDRLWLFKLLRSTRD